MKTNLLSRPALNATISMINLTACAGDDSVFHGRRGAISVESQIKIFFVLLGITLFLFPASSLASDLKERLRSEDFQFFSRPLPAADMSLQDFNNRTVRLNQLRGKVVILNFWRIDCPPCAQEKPILERVYRKYSGIGLEVVAVNLIDDHDRLRSFVQQCGFSFPIVYDPARRLTISRQRVGKGTSAFVVNGRSEAIYEVAGVPTTYVIDRKGNAIGKFAGMINWEDEPFNEFLESLLNDGVDLSHPRVAYEPGFEDIAMQGGPKANPHRTSVITVSQAGPASPQAPEIAPEPPTPAPAKKAQTIAPKPVNKPKAVEAVKPGRPKPAAKNARDKSQEVGPRVNVVPQGSTKPGAPTSGVQSLPPLPPALPYAEGQKSRAPIVTVPKSRPALPAQEMDTEGNIMATIPDAAPPGQTRPAGPTAEADSGRRTIGNMIYQSVNAPQQKGQAPIPVQTGQSPQPAASAVDQLNRDVRNLGSGIRETFSNLFSK